MIADHCKVLNKLAELRRDDEEFSFTTFANVAKSTHLTRSRVRFICRLLARRGLTEYCNGLADRDGAFRGAGYRITPAGMKALEDELEAPPPAPPPDPPDEWDAPDFD